MSRWIVRWGLALVGAVLLTQTAAAQVANPSQGWPGMEPPAAAAPARPADKPKTEAPAPKKRPKLCGAAAESD